MAAAALLLAAALLGLSAEKGAAARSDGFSLAGRLLVATDRMDDPRFIETVIFMVWHGTDGAMGVIVNRPLGDVGIEGLLEHLGVESEGITGSIMIHYGGPVEERQGLILHSSDYLADGTIVVDEAWALTAQFDLLRDIGAGEGPRRSLLVFGYAGWAPGQLEAEIAAGHWVSIPAEESLVFDANGGSKWERAIDRHGYSI